MFSRYIPLYYSKVVKLYILLLQYNTNILLGIRIYYELLISINIIIIYELLIAVTGYFSQTLPPPTHQELNHISSKEDLVPIPHNRDNVDESESLCYNHCKNAENRIYPP